jgi:hypothetical protein
MQTPPWLVNRVRRRQYIHPYIYALQRVDVSTSEQQLLNGLSQFSTPLTLNVSYMSVDERQYRWCFARSIAPLSRLPPQTPPDSRRGQISGRPQTAPASAVLPSVVLPFLLPLLSVSVMANFRMLRRPTDRRQTAKWRQFLQFCKFSCHSCVITSV